MVRLAAILMLGLLLLLAGALAGMLLWGNAPGETFVAAAATPTAATEATPGAKSSEPTAVPTAMATYAGPTIIPTIVPAATPTATPSAPTPTPQPTLPVDSTLDAALARCPTAAEIEFVDARITLSFHDDPTAPKLVCKARDGSADLTRLQESAYQAVLTLRRIEFDEPLPWTDRSTFGWFTHAVTGIQFRDVPYSYCCDGVKDLVIRTSADMGWQFDDYWISRDENHLYGLAGLVGLLVHEARHAEGDHPHTCAYDESAGGYTDDQTVAEMGAWAVNFLFFQWIAEHSDVDYMTPIDAPPELYRDQARETAEYLSMHRICDNYETAQ
jgi:hypothetical protein